MSKKILVIEDVDYLRNDVLEMLKYEGYHVAGAQNGRVGVDMAREYFPDLIICDIMMPEMSGFEVLQELRSSEATATIPFIFLTAKTDRIDMRNGMSMGADDYLTKPFLSGELLDTIEARLQKVEIHKKKAQQKVDELINQISTSLPHELRTPLNTIIGFSDMLILEAASLKPEQVMEWSQHINSSALRLYHLIENYLTYIRIESISHDEGRRQNMLSKSTEIPATTIEFAAIHSSEKHKRGDDFSLELNATTPIAMLDSDLAKIVDEILGNAFKFSKEGDKVTLSALDKDGELVIVIRDNGRGMTEEQIASVGAYVQFDRMIHEQQGVGLGLTIAKRTAELYNGSLEIKSEPEAYTEVTIKLPHKQD